MSSDARGDDHPAAEPPGQDRGDRRDGGHGDREGQRAHPGGQRAVAVHQLEVLGQHEQAAEQGEEDHGYRGGRRRERPDREHPQVDQRVRDAQLPPGEQAQPGQCAAISARVTGPVQPRVGASMMASTRRNSAPAIIRVPAKSSR